MARNLLSLSRRMQRIREQIPVEADRIKREVAEAVATDLIRVTPVDVSEALSNWQVGINQPPAFPLPAIYPGQKGDTESASEQAAIDHAKRVILDSRPGAPLYVSNVVEHIVPLNDGTSRQEPGGFVERAIVLGRVKLRKARLKLGG